ncbi:uncharacterized protein K452DRAFT_217519 [Aplosporella prunicola CBS 121167]|uniref:IgE-binding protein n=1 Tax=Aplosporella prunicola CBS 121167 TaxID=1176127 RepID=A0A6A6BTH5_9PEZI|nr:uncharacterized protein K452DRAFT_217519 [Aplosporella prunicola CBS 121167]KAF2147290.1 hypothetical protein K452DRAFT_217519 [Aplosporella prunicola CBS 121167]
MKTAAAATLLAAVPAVLGQNKPFEGLTVRSGSDFQYATITQAGLSFWVGKDTESYCPEASVPIDCPPGNVTAFVGGEGTLSMDVEVPGGQQVYIAPTGELKVTQAHSASMPEGSIQDGFHKSESNSLGFLHWTNGFLACPAANSTDGYPYQIYASVDGLKRTDCLGFDFLTSNYTGTGAAAWQYA